MRAVQPRAIGAGTLSVRANNAGKTQIEKLRHSGATKLVFPKGYGPDLEAILVNTAGGITGGDHFSLDIALQPNAAFTLTTQAAERAYRAQPDEIGQVTNTVTVASGAQLHWLPQELILFDHSALKRRLNIELAKDARLVMVEPIVFGRAAMRESLTQVEFRDHITLTRGGHPIFIDKTTLQGNATRHLARAAIAGGAGALASIVIVRPDAATLLDPIREKLGSAAGASLIADDVLVVRLLAQDSFDLRRTLVPVLERATGNSLPISWRL